MENPWLGFGPADRVYVHRDDRRHVEAFNRIAESGGYKLVTTAWPQPWAGPIVTARVLVLSANPGWSDDDAEWDRRLSPLLEQNLTGTRPLLWLDPGAEGSPGAEWVRNRLVCNVLDEVADEVVADRVCLVEFHAYHAVNWRPLPVTLPSQWFTFEQVRARLAEGAVVILTRAAKAWKVAVPELLDSSNVFETHSTQNTRLSAKNLGNAAWRVLLDRLHAVDRIGLGDGGTGDQS